MTTVEDIRHANLLALIAEAGSQRALADRISDHEGRPLAPAQISQWVKRAPDSKTGKPRVIHSSSAQLCCPGSRICPMK